MAMEASLFWGRLKPDPFEQFEKEIDDLVVRFPWSDLGDGMESTQYRHDLDRMGIQPVNRFHYDIHFTPLLSLLQQPANQRQETRGQSIQSKLPKMDVH
jgi:hypothetical protein